AGAPAPAEDGRRADPAADDAYWANRRREEDDRAGADPASLTTQALPQIKPQPRSGEGRQGGSRQPRQSGSRRAAAPGGGRRSTPPTLEPPTGPGKPVAPKPVAPADVPRGTAPGASGSARRRSTRSRPAEPADPADPAPPGGLPAAGEQAETEAALESASTRTQEDVSRYMPPELPEDPPEGASAETPEVVPRYAKKADKAGRHAGP
ncbi:MAG: hypothetical protein FWJ90_13060, partial [Actinomadura sp.]